MAKKILIVEDDKMLLTIFQMFVQELGYELAGIARTGRDAINVAQNIPDLSCVLMDILLDGDLDGKETASLMMDKIDAPVIFVTGGATPEIVHDCVMPNVYGFMSKPLYKQSLGVSIEYACTKYKMDHQKK